MQNPETKNRLLDAAERLIAEHGYSGTSLRAVTAEAGANTAAIHYHFGSKVALLEAIFERRVRDVNDERLARLAEQQARHPDGVPIDRLLEAFFLPALLRIASEDEGWARFTRVMGRILGESGDHVQAIHEVFAEVRLKFFPAFREALPHLDAASFTWRLFFLLGAMCNLLSDPERVKAISHGLCDTSDPEATAAQFLAFAEAALIAPAVSPVGRDR